MKHNDLITVVIPCYNIEKYVCACIDSVIHQTYKKIQIIIVNDGSTDNTKDIIKTYLSDKRVEIINQKNKGLSAARNAGILKAKGKYVCFIDGDDYVADNYIESLYAKMIEESADIVACNYYIVSSNRKIGKKIKADRIFSNIEAMKDLFTLKQLLSVMAWNKLYKTKIFKENNIFYPVGKIHEDNFTTYKLFYYTKRIALIKEPLYYYIQRNNSIMNSHFNERHFDIIEAVESAKDFCSKNGIEKNLKKELESYEINTKFHLSMMMLRAKKVNIKYNNLIDDLLDKKREIANNEYVTGKLKIILPLLKIMRKKR